MKYSDIKYNDVLNGEGVRISIFVSGCTHDCKGCFNAIAQDENYGKEWTNQTEQDILEKFNEYKDIYSGISLLGGDPTYYKNTKILTKFCKKFKKQFPDKDIWIWSGFTYDQIKSNEDRFNLIKECDVLIEGRFVEELKNLGLKWRGSSNQKVIDIKETIKRNEIILYCE